MDKDATGNLIREHEGTRYSVYLDSVGIKTIGVGFNLQREGAKQYIEECGADYGQVCSGAAALTPEQVDSLFANDLDDAIAGARHCVDNFDEHPDEVQSAIVDMVFNLGVAGFSNFIHTIASLEAKDYCGAAREMEASTWAKQVPNRAADDIALVQKFCPEAAGADQA